jgi:tetraacyldisaccharide-1-P 4'-kinase
LDDGFQHVQLARELDLLVVDAGDWTSACCPSGRLLRAARDSGRSDALLVGGTDEDAAVIGERLGIGTIFRIHPAVRDAEARTSRFGAPLPSSIGRRVVAVAGIARPERFFRCSSSRRMGRGD